eukprot:9356665-Pyramimonas_sp.AAC.1
MVASARAVGHPTAASQVGGKRKAAGHADGAADGAADGDSAPEARAKGKAKAKGKGRAKAKAKAKATATKAKAKAAAAGGPYIIKHGKFTADISHLLTPELAKGCIPKNFKCKAYDRA